LAERATIHWAAFHLLHWLGAIPVNERVVVDGAWVFARTSPPVSTAPCASPPSSVPTTSHKRSSFISYAPEPPFDSGTPETAPATILDEARRSVRTITAQREQTARRVAAKPGIAVPAAAGE